MRILTVQQPWASLIAVGEKDVENRRWATAYRGPVAVHAGKAVDPAAKRDPVVLEAMSEHQLDFGDLPAGMIVAVADITDCHQSEGMCCVPWGIPGDAWQHLLLGNIRPLRTPIEFTGQLGLRILEGEDVAEVMAAL